MNIDFTITNIFKVIYVGSEEYPEKETSYITSFNQQELIYNISGESTVYFGDKIFNVKPGTIRYIPKGDFKVYTVKRKTMGDCFDIYFDSDVLINDKPFLIKVFDNKKIEELFKKAFTAWVKKDNRSRFEAMSSMYKIFSELNNENYITSKKYKHIEPAINYINENFLKQNITYNDLSKICEISPAYLKRIFVEKFGLPPRKYITRLKINFACDLLKDKNYSVGQVSQLSGFENIYYFSRVFKEQMGITPTEFKSKYKSSK